MCTVMEVESGPQVEAGQTSERGSSPSVTEDNGPGRPTPVSSPSPSCCSDISVGCSTPRSKTPATPATPMTPDSQVTVQQTTTDSEHTSDEEYFRPLKRLKMLKIKPGSASPPSVGEPVTERHRSKLGLKSFSILDILTHRPARKATEQVPAGKIVRPWDLDEDRTRRREHRSASSTSTASAASSSGPERSGQGGQGTSPLDALFQMTNKTFEGLNGAEGTEGGQGNHLNLFNNNRQQAKKKRKSRTAFTNHQIFELEKRFLYQKYLSPADRDEIAQQLGLTNAQVITWFQNRRAKLKRDMEELKKDVESAKLLTAHKSFMENVQDLGLLKKKADDKGESVK